MKYKVDELVARLASGADLLGVLREMELSRGQALLMLRGRRGRQRLGRDRTLARIHAHLVALRYSPFAVARLCELMSQRSPELRLKGAMALLGVAGFKEFKRRLKGAGKGETGEGEATVDDATLRDMMEKLLGAKRGGEEGGK